MDSRAIHDRHENMFYDEIDSAFASMQNQLSVLDAEANVLRAENSALSTEVDELHIEVERLRELLEQQEKTTVFGACPTNGVSGTNPSLASMQAVVDKFGPGVAIRTFIGASSNMVSVNRLPKSSVEKMHVSWKPTSVGVITDAAVQSACINLLPGDVVEVWHESDKKVRDGVFSMAECLARKNAFYDAVKRVRPDLLVVNTLTGWEADEDNPSTQGNIDKWAQVRADLLGLDCDGVNVYPYTSYDSEIATAVDFVDRFNVNAGGTYKGWSVPEFTVDRHATYDVNGSNRIAWAQQYATKFRDAGADYVCWFDYNMSSTSHEALELSNEINAWKQNI